MKKTGITVLVLSGGVLRFGAHLFWHVSAGIKLFSSGSQLIQGVVFTLRGMVVGIVLYRTLSKT